MLICADHVNYLYDYPSLLFLKHFTVDSVL